MNKKVSLYKEKLLWDLISGVGYIAMTIVRALINASEERTEEHNKGLLAASLVLSVIVVASSCLSLRACEE